MTAAIAPSRAIVGALRDCEPESSSDADASLRWSTGVEAAERDEWLRTGEELPARARAAASNPVDEAATVRAHLVSAGCKVAAPSTRACILFRDGSSTEVLNAGALIWHEEVEDEQATAESEALVENSCIILAGITAEFLWNPDARISSAGRRSAAVSSGKGTGMQLSPALLPKTAVDTRGNPVHMNGMRPAVPVPN